MKEIVRSRACEEQSRNPQFRISIAEWAALFKNLRGVVLFPDEPDREKIKWLARKHRYRRLGIAPEYRAAAEIPELGRAPFVPLAFPSPELERLADLLSHKAPKYVIESLVLSCCYSSPLVIADESLFGELEPFILWKLKSKEKLKEKDLIFHLRVASYVIIDFFDLAQEAFAALSDLGKLERLCAKRKEKAEKDGFRRFWRIPPDPEGRVICAYVDLLPSLLEELRKGNEKLSELCSSEWIALSLPITCAFNLEI